MFFLQCIVLGAPGVRCFLDLLRHSGGCVSGTQPDPKGELDRCREIVR